MFGRKKPEVGTPAPQQDHAGAEAPPARPEAAPGGRSTAAGPAGAPTVDLTVRLGALSLPNPVLTASGCAANGRELARFYDITQLGAFVTKTVLSDPRAGRGTPRMAETPSGMLNSIGLQGPGIDAFVEHDLAWLASVGARVLPSIGGTEPREFVHVAKVLADSPAFASCVGVEVNISCPNVASRGQVFACDPVAAADVVERVRKQLPHRIPVFVKLSPDVTDIVGIARAVVHAGADGLVLINTALGLVVDTDRLRPALAGITGGLSGPAIRPLAVRAVWQVHASMRSGALPRRPIIGVGGIRCGADALQFLAAGAAAIQVGTAIFNDPHAPLRVRQELEAELTRHGLASVGEAVGVAHERLPG